MEENKNLNEEMEEVDVIALTTEEGIDEEYEILDTIEVEGKEYYVTLPVEENPEEIELVIFGSDAGAEEGEEDFFIPEDEICEKVYEKFMAAHGDEFDFVD
ncbi:MAG: DUF1292 domain-containing protein [Eubacteriales bacterium]|nr:DUF1292 domain-containing protein [Eubacteriales bacterium]